MPATVWIMKEALSMTSIRTDTPWNGSVRIFAEKSRRVRPCSLWKKETGECPEPAWERLQEYSSVRKCTEEGAEGKDSVPGSGIFPEEKELYDRRTSLGKRNITEPVHIKLQVWGCGFFLKLLQ